MITLLNIYCMEYMATVPDKYFDLAIVDPPYGILSTSGDRLDHYGTKYKEWDEAIPTHEYFIELFRVSKNQIIWGGNYFPYLWGNGCKGFIFWYKHQPIQGWAAGELAWTSFNKPAMCFDYMCYGGVNQDKDRFHPTQKPLQLYKWLLKNYAKPEFKIIDTHLGSGSSAIAAYDFGVAEFVGCEIDKEYFDAAKQRFEIHKRQTVIKF